VGVLDQNVLFSTFDLENDGQGHIFSTSKYQKRVVGKKTEQFELSHVEVGRLVCAVCRSKKKYIPPVSVLIHTSSLAPRKSLFQKSFIVQSLSQCTVVIMDNIMDHVHELNVIIVIY
jgi:hypothetical protein